MAEPLADAYTRAGEDLGFPLPTDFELTRGKMREADIADFVGFIREWRKRARLNTHDHADNGSGKVSAGPSG